MRLAEGPQSALRWTKHSMNLWLQQARPIFEAAVAMVSRWRFEGHEIGFTNGCFDILHAGHVTLLDKEGLTGYGQVCGAVLARAHARAGDASIITGYLGDGEEFDEAVAEFSLAYAKINESDHASWSPASSERDRAVGPGCR